MVLSGKIKTPIIRASPKAVAYGIRAAIDRGDKKRFYADDISKP
jgi:hypothetical protein